MRVPFGRLKEQLKVHYKGHLLKKRYIPDLHVFNEIMVELKAVKALTSEHEQQLLNYMHITKKAVGYLINLRPASVEWKREALSPYALRAPRTGELRHRKARRSKRLRRLCPA